MVYCVYEVGTSIAHTHTHTHTFVLYVRYDERGGSFCESLEQMSENKGRQ